jgi:hypothetical protein
VSMYIYEKKKERDADKYIIFSCLSARRDYAFGNGANLLCAEKTLSGPLRRLIPGDAARQIAALRRAFELEREN